MKTYFIHLGFEGLGTAGGYYARTFCRHTWHRVTLAVAWSMLTTAILVSQVG